MSPSVRRRLTGPRWPAPARRGEHVGFDAEGIAHERDRHRDLMVEFAAQPLTRDVEQGGRGHVVRSVGRTSNLHCTGKDEQASTQRVDARCGRRVPSRDLRWQQELDVEVLSPDVHTDIRGTGTGVSLETTEQPNH